MYNNFMIEIQSIKFSCKAQTAITIKFFLRESLLIVPHPQPTPRWKRSLIFRAHLLYYHVNNSDVVSFPAISPNERARKVCSIALPIKLIVIVIHIAFQ